MLSHSETPGWLGERDEICVVLKFRENAEKKRRHVSSVTSASSFSSQ